MNLNNTDVKKQKKDLSKFSRSSLGAFKTGVLPLDVVTGGLFWGSMIELHSPAGLGKTTLCLSLCSAFLDKNWKVLYLDSEKGIKDSLLESFNLSNKVGTSEDNDFILLNPVSFEEATEILTYFMETNLPQLVILDSITSLIPGKLLEKDNIFYQEVGLEARYTSLFLKRFKTLFSVKESIFIVVSQMRYKSSANLNFQLSAAGGTALEFMPDVRIFLQKKADLIRTEETLTGPQKVVFGVLANILAEKNRLNRPKIPVVCPIIFGKGVSNVFFLKEVMEANNLITRRGTSYFKLNVIDTEVTLKGQSGLYSWIKDNYTTVLTYLQDNGYLTLTRGELDD